MHDQTRFFIVNRPSHDEEELSSMNISGENKFKQLWK